MSTAAVAATLTVSSGAPDVAAVSIELYSSTSFLSLSLLSTSSNPRKLAQGHEPRNKGAETQIPMARALAVVAAGCLLSAAPSCGLHCPTATSRPVRALDEYGLHRPSLRQHIQTPNRLRGGSGLLPLSSPHLAQQSQCWRAHHLLEPAYTE